jgi:hypothetical protein
MKKILLSLTAILLSGYCMAQNQLSFPFQGGKEGMDKFFKDSLTVSPEIIQKKAIGTAVFKFTANDKGVISKIIIYYADDVVLANPIIEVLKKSNHKWIIPDKEKTHDFIITFAFGFNAAATDDIDLLRTVYDNYRTRATIHSNDQVPLNEATLLPNVVVKYDITQ